MTKRNQFLSICKMKTRFSKNQTNSSKQFATTNKIVKNTLIRPKRLNKIQKEIIAYVNKNNSSLNFSLLELKNCDQIFEKANEIKNSCLAIVSDKFGSAVCIKENGFILTCAHAAPPVNKTKSNKNYIYLIFPNKELILAETVEKDEDLDLALLKVIAVKIKGKFKRLEELKNKKFPFVNLNENFSLNTNANKNEKVFCIGNPSFTEYENDNQNFYLKNEYMPFWLSKGKIKGYMQDEIYGDFDLGPMIHSCWTYWGHSGAPIFNYDLELIGIHNSWNDQNANRHAISLLGISKFLSKFDFLNNKI